LVRDSNNILAFFTLSLRLKPLITQIIVTCMPNVHTKFSSLDSTAVDSRYALAVAVGMHDGCGAAALFRKYLSVQYVYPGLVGEETRSGAWSWGPNLEGTLEDHR
jgi:hypothetical protein